MQFVPLFDIGGIYNDCTNIPSSPSYSLRFKVLHVTSIAGITSISCNKHCKYYKYCKQEAKWLKQNWIYEQNIDMVPRSGVHEVLI